MDIKLDQIKGVGPQMLRMLRNQGIWSTYDLILHTPKAYEDFSITSLSEIKDQDVITVLGTINSELKVNRYTKGEHVTFTLSLFNQTIKVIIFGRSYVQKTFQKGDEVIIKGTYHLYQKQINAQSILKPDRLVEIKPIYKIEGLKDKVVSNVIKEIYEEKKVAIYENIPSEFLNQYHLLSRQDAYHHLHFPKDFKEIEQARRRLKYEEAFYLQLKLAAKQPNLLERAPKAYDIHQVRAFIDTLPYSLTQDQKNAVNDIYRDFKKGYASYRLIQGDVGSGKTIVSLIAIYACINASEQVSLMAPTELLANQHYQYFKAHLKDARIALLTGKTKNKDQLKKDIEAHQYDLVIGTQALIEDNVIFNHLGLVVIDEQHKFGVSTRDELLAKAHAKDVLYLTATPIPRTLAMILFGESHVSVIKEKPKNRIPIDTLYLTKSRIKDVYTKIQATINQLEHVFVVVPAITSEKVTDNITTVYEQLKENIKAPIFILHGKLSHEEKELAMETFMYTPGSILLSTTMIEVGIDIPTATLMVIFAAENFGLSQLHQLRGRVGRSSLKSSCYLVSEKEDIPRLELLSKERDGFKLSEYDLVARGPGDFLGVDQSGYLKFNYLELLDDYPILVEAQKNVESLIARSDFMTNPIYKYINRYFKEV